MEKELVKWTDKEVATITIKREVTEDDINIIVCGWLEGGMSCLYAYGKDNNFVKDTEVHNKYYWSDYATKILLDGGTLHVDDTEDDKMYELTLEKLLKGIELNAQNRDWDNYFNDNHDAITYDCIIQYAIFDDVVYG